MRYVKKYGRKLLMIYWKTFKPLSLGARVMVINKDKVLLVKHTYVSGYYLPGGGMKKNELFKNTAKRELFEETGISAKTLELFGIFQETQERKYTLNAVYLAKLEVEPKIVHQNDELLEAKFFKIKDLPKETSPGTKRRINEYLSKKYPVTGEW